jgi:predicted phosphodiesterase
MIDEVDLVLEAFETRHLEDVFVSDVIDEHQVCSIIEKGTKYMQANYDAFHQIDTDEVVAKWEFEKNKKVGLLLFAVVFSTASICFYYNVTLFYPIIFGLVIGLDSFFEYFFEPIFKDKQKVVIFGDIHGEYETLFYIYQEFISQKTTTIFVGDLIDRSKDSLKCFLVVICLILKHNNVIYVRGNHETESQQLYANKGHFTLNHCIVKEYYDFDDWFGGKFDKTRIMAAALEFFKFLPLVLRVNKVLVMHGGLFQHEGFDALKDFEKMKRVVDPEHGSPERKILWNDVAEKWTKGFKWNFVRGNHACEQAFGKEATRNFFAVNKKVEVLIRGHSHLFGDEPVDGFHLCHDKRIITLISFLKNKTPGGGVILQNDKITLFKFWKKRYLEYNEHGLVDKEFDPDDPSKNIKWMSSSTPLAK